MFRQSSPFHKKANRRVDHCRDYHDLHDMLNRHLSVLLMSPNCVTDEARGVVGVLAMLRQQSTPRSSTAQLFELDLF
jgi:hypothetical protein